MTNPRAVVMPEQDRDKESGPGEDDGPAHRESVLPRRAPIPLPLPGSPPVLDLVVPVLNEEAGLERGVRRLHAHLRAHFPYPFRITVADNASSDATPRIAVRLAEELPEVGWLRLEEKGRGRALRAAWARSSAPVLAYVDVDLSTGLDALLPLVAPLMSGHSDLAIGTRLAPGARVVRGPKREFISRGYNTLLRSTLAVGFTDAQCGFKAVRRDVAERLVPLVRDEGWFFDTELLVIAERAGLRIHEVPVDWVDDPDSRVDLLSTALADLRGIVRIGSDLARGMLPLASLRRGGPEQHPDRHAPQLRSQLIRFAAIGALSTLAHLGLYAALRPAAGAQTANALALFLCALANTAANRRLTFGVRGRGGALRHQARGLAVLAVGLALTSGSLALLHHTAPDAGARVELVVLVAANLAATLLRFLLFRAWVFGTGAHRRRTTGPTGR
ncbi:glycosyltransferase [Streptomyces sp. NPDC088387]|uniref:glycosyltransferase n=1 Tax=Streptomyces sp. NPDC088387 TaxID=3365859 RepID=UPI00380165F9